MTAPSDSGAERRTPCPAGAQARPDRIRRRRHRHRRAAPLHAATHYGERFPSVHAQLDLFGTAAPADPLLGLAVKLPNTCSKCADLVAIIGPGKAAPFRIVALPIVRASSRLGIARHVQIPDRAHQQIRSAGRADHSSTRAASAATGARSAERQPQ